MELSTHLYSQFHEVWSTLRNYSIWIHFISFSKQLFYQFMTLSASRQVVFPIGMIFRLNVNICFSSRLNTNFSQSQNLYSKSKYYSISLKMIAFLKVTWSGQWGLRLYRGIIDIFYYFAFFTNKIILTYSKILFCI